MNFETESRRRFLMRSGNGVGAMALSTLINPSLVGSLNANEQNRSHPGLPQFPNFAPKAKKDNLSLYGWRTEPYRYL